MMKLWVFYRSGAFSSEKLDFTQSPSSWIKTMVSYTMMDNEEVGFKSFIKQDGQLMEQRRTDSTSKLRQLLLYYISSGLVRPAMDPED